MESCEFMSSKVDIKINEEKYTYYKNKWNILIGKNKSGKTTLLKELSLLFPQEKVFYVDDKPTYPQEKIITNLLLDFENQKIIEEILKIFNINDLMLFKDYQETIGIYQLLNFINMYLKKPEIIILDQAFSMIDHYHKQQLFNWLKKDTKKKNITIIITIDWEEELLFGDYFTFIKDKHILSTGLNKKVFRNEQIFIDCNQHLPFVLQLYHKLKYYDVVDKPVYKLESMIDELWK